MEFRRFLGKLLRAGAVLVAAHGAASLYAEPVTIRFAVGSGGDNLLVLKKSVAEFEALHPNIRIKVEPIVDNFENKLLSEYAASIAPDCAIFNAGRLVPFATRGALMPMENFPDLNGPEVDLKGRYQNAVDAFVIGGKHYAIPMNVSCSAFIYYNLKAFDDAHIPYPDGSWTWDTHVRPELREKDFIWVMQQLTKTRPGERRPYQYGFTSSWPQLWMESLLMSSDVKMWDSDEDPKQMFLDDPKVVEVFQFASDTANKEHWIPSNNDVTLGSGSTMQDEFRKGHIAMLESGAWEIKNMRLKHPGRWDIAPFPRFARGKTDYLPGEEAGIGIFSTTKHPQETWEWVKFHSGPRGLIRNAQAGQDQPSIRALALQPGIWLPAKDATGTALMPAHLSITDAVGLRVHTRHVPDWFYGIFNEFSGSYYAVLSGERTAQSLLTSLQRNMPDKLALARRRIVAPDYPFAAGLTVGIAIVAALLAWIYVPEIKKRRTRAEKAESRSAYWFLVPWFCGLALTVGPMIYSLLLSFAESDIIRTPKWRGMGNYADLFNPNIDDTLFVSLRQTFIFAALSIPTGLVAALALAVLLNQKVRGIPLFRALYYIPSLASAVAMSLLWMRMFDKDQGIINLILYGSDGKSGFLHLGPLLSRWMGTPGEPINWLGNSHTVIPAFVIMGLWGAGGGTIIFLAGLQGISQTYYEAATIDGASIWRRFRSVTVPLLTPTIFFSVITGVIGALQVFSQSFVITSGGPDRATLFTMVWLWSKAFGELSMGMASAIAWILFAIILIITVIQLSFARKWVHYEGDLR